MVRITARAHRQMLGDPPLRPAPFLQRLLKPLPPRRTVLEDAPLAQQPIHPQPRRTFRGREQVRRPTAPGKTLQGRIRYHQFRSRRIQVDVIAHALEITAARSVHDQRLAAPGEQVAEELVTSIEATRVSAQQPFHPGDQIGLRRLDHPMKMMRHEDIGVNLPTRLGASLAQRLNEALAIRVIHEDQFAPVTAIHDVINRASILDSQLAGHDGRWLWPLYLSISKTDPFSGDSRLPPHVAHGWTSEFNLSATHCMMPPLPQGFTSS